MPFWTNLTVTFYAKWILQMWDHIESLQLWLKLRIVKDRNRKSGCAKNFQEYEMENGTVQCV